MNELPSYTGEDDELPSYEDVNTLERDVEQEIIHNYHEDTIKHYKYLMIIVLGFIPLIVFKLSICKSYNCYSQ